MDLESESSVLESVEDNEVTQERIPNDDENEIRNNGSCPNEYDKLGFYENSSVNTLLIDAKENDFDSAEPENSPPLNADFPGGDSSPMRKGYGLKKWRRIRREFVKDASASVDTSKVLKRGSSGSGNPIKVQHFPLEFKQNSEGSVGSANVLRTMGVTDGFAMRGSSPDSRFAVGSAFAACTDSENSEDRSSKSSTAASAPKVRHELPAMLGHVREKNRMKNISGKNSGNSTPKGQPGKGRIEGSKKHRGERVKIEKENSLSSMESDSRSSNFVFMQGTYTATSNGKQSRRSMNYDGDNSDEAHASEQQFGEEVQTGYSKENVGGVEDLSQYDLAADLPWGFKEENSENHRSTDREHLVESLFSLLSVQEALEKEVQKLREIDFSTTDLENHTPTALSFLENQVLSLTKKVKFLESKLEEANAMLKAKESRIAELEATINSSKSPKDEKFREIETEIEGLFKQKIEAEVEYLTITRTMQKLKVGAGEQLTLFEEQKVLAGEQAQVLNKLGEVGTNAEMIKKQAEELEEYCGDFVRTEEVLKMQGRVCKITTCFFIQLILLVLVFCLFVLQLSPHSGVVVPT